MKHSGLSFVLLVLAFMTAGAPMTRAQGAGGFGGKWNQTGSGHRYLVISSVASNYTGVYVVAERTCRFREVSISGNTIRLVGSYESGEGVRTDLDFNLTLSDDGIMLTGTMSEDIHWAGRGGRPVHNEETTAVTFIR